MKIQAVGSRARLPTMEMVLGGETGQVEEHGKRLKASPLPCSTLAGSQGFRGLDRGWGNVVFLSLGSATSEQSGNGVRVWAADDRSLEMTMA